MLFYALPAKLKNINITLMKTYVILKVKLLESTDSIINLYLCRRNKPASY